MALAQLNEEQTRTWTREQKDRWWYENFYRGSMPQLTIRAAITGFFMGGILSATNLYIGGKTGVSLGVGLTSVILAFALFRALAQAGFKDFTILENNALQSIATSAGYVSSPLISSLAAYMLVSGNIPAWWQIVIWLIVISVIGVLVAFPMKRKFINDDQLPFPEGGACGVVLDALYNTGEKGGGEGVYKARVLGIAAAIAGAWQFLCSDALMKYALLKKSAFHVSEHLDDMYYWAVAKYSLWKPEILGTDFKTLGLRLTADLSMFGVGGLMGIRVAGSVFIGAFVNFVILAPIIIQRGEIAPYTNAAGKLIKISRGEIVNQWSLWWGVTMMVVGSLVALLGKPELFTSAFKTLSGKKSDQPKEDVLKDIELPLWISAVGVPIMSLIAAWVTNAFFGVPFYYVLLAFPLIFILTVICTNSMALTSWTPTGSLSKITQFSFGALDRTNPATNLTTAGMTAEIAANAANLLSDIKPGYMLGAKPRQQAIGHVIGIFAGALAAVPLFFVLFLRGKDGNFSVDNIVSDAFGFPAALQWKGVADIIAKGLKSLPATAIWSMIVAAVIAATIEIYTIVRKKAFPLSTVSIGLGVVLPPNASFTMFLGAVFFWWMKRKHTDKESKPYKLWVDSMEPICAGLITGAALIGIANTLVGVFFD